MYYYILGFGLFCALAIVLCLCDVEKAPDWVEMDEYYRNRWYK